MKSSSSQHASDLRFRAVEFLIESASNLQVAPVIKYSALSLFAGRFVPSISGCKESNAKENWLLQPLREGNLQLFALVAIWVSSKIHNARPLSVKSLKSLGDNGIREQHFTTRDFREAEVVFLQVDLRRSANEDGFCYTSGITFRFLEELFIQFKEVAKVGELVSFEACMEIMDLLYEKEEMSTLYRCPRSLAASILVASYVITVPKQRWEFPVLPWVNFTTSCKEDDIAELVRDILMHIFGSPC